MLASFAWMIEAIQISGAEPRAAELDIDGNVVRTNRDVQPHVQAVLARDLVTKAHAAGHHDALALELLKIIPSDARAGKADDTEATPALPAQFEFRIGRMFADVAPHRRPAQMDIRPGVERDVIETEKALGLHAQR